MHREAADTPAYILSANANRSFLADIDADPSVDMAAIYCSRAAPPPRMSARWVRGAKVPTGMVVTSHAFAMLVHESVLEAFRDARIGGWHAVPVDLFGRNHQPIADYHFLCVRGRCGALHSGPDGGMHLDLAGWDGTDLFVAEGTTTTLVTPRAHRVIDALRERHVRLLPVRFTSAQVAEAPLAR